MSSSPVPEPHEGAPPKDNSTIKEKILKRAEMSRITRMLKSRLEIAQFKVGRSWQNLPFKSVEPQLEREAKMRNPDAFAGGDARHTHVSSPPTDPEFLVPDVPTRGKAPQERPARQSTPAQVNGHGTGEPSRHRISPLKRHRSDSFEHDTPELESSPIKYRPSTSSLRDRIDPRVVHGHITPPPSTPPPSHLRQAHNSNNNNNNGSRRLGGGGSGEDAEEGADLLLYLATSPSPAKSRRTNTRPFEAFSSPPPMRGSSAVNTPVGAGFNLSEFLNFTP